MDDDDLRMRKYWLGCVGAVLVLVFGVYGVLYAAGQANAKPLSFQLTAQDGRLYNSSDYPVYKLVFFGFTQCAEICPTGLSAMNAAIMNMEDAGAVQPVFITVDAGRDNPNALKGYLENFPVNFVGLSGEPEQLLSVWNRFEVYAKQISLPGQVESIDHSTHIYLLDKNDILIDTFDYRASPEDLAKAIEYRMRQRA